MKVCLLLSSLFFIYGSGFTIAQQTRWTVGLDSANIFSSPRFADLNEDGIQDVVLGAGIEATPSRNGIVAIDGKSGAVLWTVPSPTQTYTSAMFQDINGDGTDDVFIGGRAGSFFAINGRNGNILWEFFPEEKGDARKAGFLNFFATQWIDDQNSDGYSDLLVTNGGDYLAAPTDKNRATARIMLLSAKDGAVLNSSWIPEKRESYYAPHLLETEKESKIIFGTGGETIDGGLWEVSLDDFLKDKMKKAKLIVHDTVKGFILNSVLTDLNGDLTPDILNARMSGVITAINGADNTTLWEHRFPGYECYVTPSLGQFTDDRIPDFFTIIAKGTFPMYSEWRSVIVDGANGEIIYDKVTGFNQFSPIACADLDQDGTDEIIMVENTMLDMEQFLMINQVKVINLAKNQTYYVGTVRKGLSMASAPTLVDLDMDGQYELVLSTTTMENEGKTSRSTIQCIDLLMDIPQITWPAYLGPLENGFLPTY